MNAKVDKIWTVKSNWSGLILKASNMEVAIRKYKRYVKKEWGGKIPRKDYEPTEVALVGEAH